MTGGVPALQTPEQGILEQVHWSFSQLQSSEHANQSDGLYRSSSLLQKYISQELSNSACLKHMDGVHAWWLKDEWKMLESPFLGLGMGNQAKLASCVTPATVTFLLENVWARGMVARAMESASSQHWWFFTIVMFTVPFICPACYGRFLLFRPTGYNWSLPKFWAFPCKKQVEILTLSVISENLILKSTAKYCKIWTEKPSLHWQVVYMTFHI